MKIKTLAPSLLVSLIALPLNAEWVLVEDFEDGNLDQWTFYDEYCDTPEEDPVNCGVHEIVADPIDEGSGNHAGLFRPGPLDTFPSQQASILPFPDPVLPEYDGLFTVHFRMAIENFTMDTVFGTYPIGPEFDTFSYSDYEVVARVSLNQKGRIEMYNNEYIVATPDPLENMEWYNVWLVHNNDNDLDNNPEEALSYDMYIQGGIYGSQTVLVDTGFYRRAEGEIRALVLMQFSGFAASAFGTSAFFLDDIYIDYEGENLAMPTEGGGGGGEEPIDEALAFFGLDSDEGGDFWLPVEGSFGWAYAEQFPWIYQEHPGSQAWLYTYQIPGDFTAGSWFYNMNQGQYWFISAESTAEHPWVYIHGEGWVLLSADG